MEPLRFYIVLLLLSGLAAVAQVPAARALALRQAYENRAAHDSIGRRYVQELIALSRQYDDPAELSQTLRDAIIFETDPATKLEYATGAVRAAVHSGDARLIAAAQLTRGTIFAFDLRELRPALDAFLEAYAAARQSGDGYEQHKLLYFIGLMVRYRGDHATAADYFSRCVLYFRARRQGPLHPNEYYNYSRGYYNSLYQLISCLQETGKDRVADCYLKEAERDFQRKGKPREYLTFVLCHAVSAYRRGDYAGSIALLQQVVVEQTGIGGEELAKAWQYLALNYRRTGECAAARQYLLRIDSAYAADGRVHQDLPAAYALLLSDAATPETAVAHAWYQRQRRRAAVQLAAEQQTLTQRFRQQHSGPGSFLWENDSLISALLAAALAGIMGWMQLRCPLSVAMVSGRHWWRFSPGNCQPVAPSARASGVRYEAHGVKQSEPDREEKQNSGSTKAVVLLLALPNSFVTADHASAPPEVPADVPVLAPVPDAVSLDRAAPCRQPGAAVCERLLTQLEKFEENHGYLRRELNLGLLARKFHTNTKYLSYCIRDHRGQDFKPYIAGLRLEYAATRLASDPAWLRLSVEAIAAESGFGSRSHFSDSFLRRFGMRPHEYLEACRRGERPSLQERRKD